MVFDFYTSFSTMTKEDFEKDILEWCLEMEQTLNKYGHIRVHVKETEQEAE